LLGNLSQGLYSIKSQRKNLQTMSEELETSVEEPQPMDDDQVIERVCAGEVDLFEVVMRRYNQRIYRTVRSILRDDDEAVDVMQEAYLNAYAHLRDFSGRARFSTWLTRIAVHEAFARLRRRRRIQPLEESENEELMTPQSSGPDERASDGELRLLLEQAVDTLPEAFRTTFLLRAVEHLSVAETAEILGIPEETVKTRHHRARERLQNTLTERVGEALPQLFGFHRPRCDKVVAFVLDRIRQDLAPGTGATA
jgi:RNA polymerase sigma-70 factor (ECF subfamily)